MADLEGNEFPKQRGASMASVALSTLVTLILLVALLIAYRVRVIIDPKRARPRRSSSAPTHVLIVLGSGGHTAEMIAMLSRAVKDGDERRRMHWAKYRQRTWVVGSGDSISAQRAKEFEEMVFANPLQHRNYGPPNSDPGVYDEVTVPRARQIHQPLYTAPVSCLRCMFACFKVLLRHERAGSKVDFPDLILCNGPATATIMVLASILLRFFDVGGCNTRGKMRTVYVESWARVKRLSLSGRLLLRVIDRFLVQWPQLEESTGGKGEYLGVLV